MFESTSLYKILLGTEHPPLIIAPTFALYPESFIYMIFRLKVQPRVSSVFAPLNYGLFPLALTQ